ncbi:MAG: RIO1 family regulatory kinase/ATPase [Candidatus Bathyarchaeales archaeon]
MKMSVEDLVFSLERLLEEPFASVVCYPKASKAEIEKRLKELEKLGVKALEFHGEKQAFNVPVLGKGCVGIVVIAHRNREKAALKIRRVDADRSRMQQEAEMLKVANAVNVGPKLLGVSDNFLLMQFIDGDLLPKWLKNCRGKTRLKRVLEEVLEQCWRLDTAGLDHGELSHAPKHVIIDGENRVFIVDFETASLNRKPSNVTSIAQFLFISGAVAEKITKKLGVKDKKVLIEALRRYKMDKSRRNFERVLEVCGLF